MSYEIVDAHTGKVVAANIPTEHEAMELLAAYDAHGKSEDGGLLDMFGL